MDDEVAKSDDGPRPIPAWVMTFADLMSLLMCFFVLLLSFSEMDAQKYKQLAGSMSNAFGVQRDVKAHEIPKGISVIATEFSAGRPEPTPLNEVRQKTTKTRSDHLDWGKGAGQGGYESENQEALKEPEEKSDLELEIEQIKKDTENTGAKITEQLKEDIKAGKVEVTLEGGDRIIIRIKDKGSFPSGSATLNESFLPTLANIRKTLAETPGQITVAGHTDNKPISTVRFRSNWDLSASRASSVAHELMQGEGALKPERFVIRGHADTVPLFSNNSRAKRSQNRRVEIIIINEASKHVIRARNPKPESLSNKQGSSETSSIEDKKSVEAAAEEKTEDKAS